VLFHLVYKKENLIGPMITGKKSWQGPPLAEVTPVPAWLAVLTASAAAVAVYLLVR
jgi:hypothetical protein